VAAAGLAWFIIVQRRERPAKPAGRPAQASSLPVRALPEDDISIS